MSKLGNTFSKAGVDPLAEEVDEPAGPESADMSDEAGPGKGEVAAAKIMMRAKTAEQYASALKDFIELCMQAGY